MRFGSGCVTYIPLIPMGVLTASFFLRRRIGFDGQRWLIEVARFGENV
jgi:hypothetical protein